ncbi:MAG: hypothetical protein AAF674_18485, partial [Pseudomonadota bacterium]
IACLRQRRIPFIKIEETALISHLMPFAAERMESRSSTQGERFFRASDCIPDRSGSYASDFSLTLPYWRYGLGRKPSSRSHRR